LRVSMSDGDANFVDEINARHRNILACRRTALEEAIRIGELLIANKKAVPHGAWLKWIDKNLEFSDQTARNYIRLYENRDDLKFKSVLNLADAYALLANETDSEAPPKCSTVSNLAAAVATDSESKPAAKQKPKSVDDQIPTEPENEDTIWRRRLLERAQKATRLARFFTEVQSYVVEQKFTFDDELIDAAAQAAAAWTELAEHMRSRRLPLPPDEDPPF